MENPVRETTFYVVKNSIDVKINRQKTAELALKWAKGKMDVPVWPKEFHLETKNPRSMLDYLIILDSLNFCFWQRNEKERWFIIYNRQKYYGYFGLALALKLFFENNPEKADLKYFSKVSFRDFVSILGGGKNLLLLKKRWQIARMVSRKIIDQYGDSEKFILSAHHKLSELVPKISSELFSFNDVVHYRGKKVYILKRAQILPADIWGAFDGKGIGYFEDLEYLTAFADYKLPQILNYWGILEYSPKLLKKVKNKTLIKKDSTEEIEIRSCTIWAVEYLKKELEKLGHKFFSFQIDWILWNKSQSFNKLRTGYERGRMDQEIRISTPYHLTKTFYY